LIEISGRERLPRLSRLCLRIWCLGQLGFRLLLSSFFLIMEGALGSLACEKAIRERSLLLILVESI
jgi:hypothetical protein